MIEAYLCIHVWVLGKVRNKGMSIWHFPLLPQKCYFSSDHTFPPKNARYAIERWSKKCQKLTTYVSNQYFTICSKFWQLLRRASPHRNLVPRRDMLLLGWGRDMLPLGWGRGGEFSWPTSPICHSPHRSAGLLCCCKPCRWLRSHLRCSLPWRTDYLTADMLWNYQQTERQNKNKYMLNHQNMTEVSLKGIEELTFRYLYCLLIYRDALCQN